MDRIECFHLEEEEEEREKKKKNTGNKWRRNRVHLEQKTNRMILIKKFQFRMKRLSKSINWIPIAIWPTNSVGGNGIISLFTAPPPALVGGS